MTDDIMYNDLAALACRFRKACVDVDMEAWLKPQEPRKRSFHEFLDNIYREIAEEKSGEPEIPDLSRLMDGFREVRLEEGYTLDGFLTGVPDFGYKFRLHTRKKDNPILFVPPRWDLPPMEQSAEEKKERIRQYSSFRDNMYIRNGIIYAEMKYMEPVPLWEHLSIPFNERGLWEAVLLHVAPHMLPCFWHSCYEAYEIIFSDRQLLERARNSRFAGSNRVHPTVKISGATATAIFAEWGWNGLKQHMIHIRNEKGKVRFVREISTYLDLQQVFVNL